MIQILPFQSFFQRTQQPGFKPSSAPNRALSIALSGRSRRMHLPKVLDDMARKIDGMTAREWSSKGE